MRRVLFGMLAAAVVAAGLTGCSRGEKGKNAGLDQPVPGKAPEPEKKAEK